MQIRQIVIGVISAAFGALLTFFGASYLGWMEKTMTTSQLQKLSQMLVDEPSIREPLLQYMDKSQRFVGKPGPKGDPGPMGNRGDKGDSGGSYIRKIKRHANDRRSCDEVCKDDGGRVCLASKVVTTSHPCDWKPPGPLDCMCL